ncbi:S-layer homology domain-containing protein [Paenibacillus piri]|uniref:Uncharacterized protein n=1 Tax=Paenibacillus piri TaxID=2547395 RepID=A0A4R5KKR3_9BACL|nr:S-layer homology domain-containing protein [Paenibacillus piri]TDF96161.1 hypothetical protein E1757_17310 [Paenibacillus piri]
MKKNRFLSIMLIVVLLAGMMPVFDSAFNIAQASGTDTFFLNEDFNNNVNFPTGQAPNYADWSSEGNGVLDKNFWITETSTGTVTVEDFPGSSDRSVKITKSANNTNKAESAVDFSSQPLSGLVTVEAKVMSSGSMTGTQVAPYIVDAAGISIVKIQWNGGQIKANTGAAQNNVQAFVSNTWYTVKTVINTSNNTYDLYIDETKMLTGAALNGGTGKGVAKVTFKMDSGNNTGTIHYDNMKIYTTAPSAAVTGLEFDQNTYSIYIGDSINTVARAVYADNSKQVLTSGNAFSSSNSSIASIHPATGVVTAQNEGTTQISVSNSVYSTPATATVIVNALPVLSAPSGVSAGVVTDIFAQLNWSAASGASKYFIYRAAAGSGQYSKIGESTTNSYTDNTVAASTTYDYTVSSVFTTPGRQVIESAHSAKVSTTTSATSGFIVNDDFTSTATGSLPAGWDYILAGAGTAAVAEVPSAADKSLSLKVTNKSDAAEVDRIFPGVGGKVAIEARVMTTGDQFSVAPYIYNNNDKAVMKFGFRSGYFVAIGATKSINTKPFTANRWYDVKIVMNTGANTYDLWIDGDKQDIDREDLIVPFGGAATGITRVMFKADNSNASTSYVNNLKVYLLPPAPITDISFDRPAYTLYTDDTFQARVNTIDADGAKVNVTNGAIITSSNPGVATMDATGKITAVGTGTTQLTAAYTVGGSEYRAEATVTVNSISDLHAPQGLTVEKEWSTSVTLKWTPAAVATQYSVYRSNKGDNQYRYVGQSQPGIAAYIDNNVAPRTAYDYKVTSVFSTPGGQVIESAQSGKITAVTAAPLANFPSAATGLTVDDHFNGNKTGNTPDGWTADTSGGTVTVEEVPFPADKSVKISKSASADNATATRTFPSLNGIVTIEAKVKAMDRSGTKHIPTIYDSNGNTIARIALNNTNISYVGSNGSWTGAGVTFDADKWYIIRAVLDTTANKYDLYIDGIKKASGIPFLTEASDVAKLSFGISSGNTGTVYFDNVKIYSQATFIGGPPAPVFDVKDFDAKGDGITKDTAAIQAAIDAAAGTGGSVYLHDGVFLSGMIQLRSNMTFYIDSSATLKGSTLPSDYPDTNPLTYNTQLGPAANCNKALIYVEHAENVMIDGGGTIDGSGGSFTTGSEPTRPMAIYTVLSYNVTIQHVYITKSSMWTLVGAETDYLIIRNIYLDVRLSSNRDGIDIVDSWHVLIENVTVNTGDDAICIKSGKRRGVMDLLVRNSNVTASGTNGLKFGTASYGAFKDVRFEDVMVKGVKYCAMCVESVDGADVTNISFQRIDVQDAGNPFFVILGKRSDRTTKDDAPKKGTMDTVRFQDIIGKNMNTSWASPISGANMSDGTKYRLKNIHFDNVHMVYKGGVTSVPGNPPEYALNQYPESNIWGNLPAYGYYIRHADGVTFTNNTTDVSPADARSPFVWADAFSSTGIALDSTSFSLNIGETHNITVTQAYENGDTLDVTHSSRFESSDKNVATVDSTGKITAVGVGSAVITVSNGDYQAQVNVTVNLVQTPLITPTNLTVTGKTETTATLSWNAGDDARVTGYAIYVDGVLVEGAAYFGSGPAYGSTVSGLTAGTTYQFTVKAYDAQGNFSEASNPVSVKTDDWALSDDAALSGLTISQGILTPVFDKGTTRYSAEVAYDVNTVDVTPMSSFSAAAITVNGVPVDSGSSYTAALDVGVNTISVVVAAQNGNVQTYTLSITRAGNNSGRNRRSNNTGNNVQPAQPDTKDQTDPVNEKDPDVTSAVTVSVTLDTATRIAKAEIPASVLGDMLEKAAADKDGIKTVNIQVSAVEGASVYESLLPASYLANDSSALKIEIATPIAVVKLPGNMFGASGISKSSTVSVSVELVGKGVVIRDSAIKELIGDRPILEIHLKVDGTAVKYDNPQAPVSISVPYQPSEQEMKDPEHIVVWYIDEDGNAVKVPNGKYDTTRGMVTFRTTHFSKYAVSYVYKTFEDLGNYGWAKKQIEVLASKGLINGTSDNTFTPAESITRADFLVLLVRTLGITADFDDNFNDVSKSDYFYQELGIARKAGISEGTGNNMFNPREKISRQDMIVLCAKALKLAKMTNARGGASELDAFSDKSDAASYATESIASMVKEGIITGNGGLLNPRGYTTRAEAAVIMYRIFNKH